MKSTPITRAEVRSPETCDFLLRKVFKVPYDLIDNRTTLVRFYCPSIIKGNTTRKRYSGIW